MTELSNQLFNKETINTLFVDEWEEVVGTSSDKRRCIKNKIELKIRGVKELIRLNVFFVEVIENGLALKDWDIDYAPIKIGNARKITIKNTLLETLDKEDHYLPLWLSEHRYAAAKHLQMNYSTGDCHTLLMEKEVEPELLLEAYADLAYSSNNLERTQYVLHNGKVYERVVGNNKTYLSEEERQEYINNNNYVSRDIIIDTNGYLYGYFTTPADLNNIRLIRENAVSTAPISKYYLDKSFTYREFVARCDIDSSTNKSDLPITFYTERESEKYTYANGGRVATPFTEKIEIIIYSSRVLGEEMKELQLGDYVRCEKEGRTGFIVSVADRDKGVYEILNEGQWVYYGGEKSETFNAHISTLEKIDKPEQKDIGEIVFSYKKDPYGNVKYSEIGEVVYEFANHYLIKFPSFKRELRLRTRKGYNDYHANFVNNGDGFIYKTIKKESCRFLKKQYVYWYEKFREQSAQFEWVKEHDTLGVFMYPLFKTMDGYVCHPTAHYASYQFEAFILFAKYFSREMTAEEIFQTFVQLLGDKRYDYLRNITLRGIFDINEILEHYFCEEKEEEVDELLELLG